MTRAQVMNLSAMIVLMSASLSPLEIYAELKELGGKKEYLIDLLPKLKSRYHYSPRNAREMKAFLI